MDKYNNDSIKSLGLLGGVRAKPASIGIESHNHTFIEILANSIDEANAGHGDTIIITKNKDKSVTVKDFGRGIPMGKNRDGEYTYKKIFDELFAGGKYDNNESDDGNYLYSLGTNGLGACSTNYTSDFFIAKSYKPEGVYHVEYKEGVEVADSFIFDKQTIPDNAVGTEITWRPSKECFRGNGEVDDEFIETTLGDQSIVNGGLRFILNNVKDNYSKEYYYEEGIKGYIKSLTDDKNMLTDVISLSKEDKGKDNELDKDYRIKADIYFSFDREKSFYRYYHNSSWLENGGTPDDFIKNSFTFVIDKMLKENNLYNKNEKKILFEDVSDSLIIVSSTYSTISLFTDQTKKKIGSNFMKKSITDWLREQISVYFVENPSEAEVVMKQILVNKRSREKSEKTRLDVKKKLGGGISGIGNKIDGFYNCKSKNASEKILTICEGKSAMEAIVSGRQEYHAVFGLRGKVLNCLKASMTQITKNEVIMNLMKVIGTGIETKKGGFDIGKMNFDKIIIYVDRDEDGIGSIFPLLLTAFYRLTPTLIKEGKIYLCETPLYEIVFDDPNKEDIYAIDDKDLKRIKKEIEGTKHTISYVKGLAELSREAMAMTLRKDYPNIVQVRMDDIEESSKTLNMFMGSNVDDRKELILNSFEKDE